MTTEPNDSYARIVAELRDACAGNRSLNDLMKLANRLEKLSAASVQVTDGDVERGCVAAYSACDMGPFPEQAVDPESDRRFVRAALDAALRLSPQGECTIVHSEDPSAPAYLALGALKVTRERCG